VPVSFLQRPSRPCRRPTPARPHRLSPPSNLRAADRFPSLGKTQEPSLTHCHGFVGHSWGFIPKFHLFLSLTSSSRISPCILRRQETWARC
jgi:hypothetical protein